jgi:hypothetical protein
MAGLVSSDICQAKKVSIGGCKVGMFRIFVEGIDGRLRRLSA